MFKIIIGVIVVAVIGLGVFMAIDPNNTTNEVTTDTTNTTTFQATIEGEVYKSGTYTLKEGATMADLIETAGGLSDNADELCFFTTTEIVKGNSYYIAPKYDENDICNMKEITKVNINVDSAEELMAINGFTSSIASSVVSYRAENGTFTTLEQLMDVYGIGNATYRKVRNYVILHE